MSALPLLPRGGTYDPYYQWTTRPAAYPIPAIKAYAALQIFGILSLASLTITIALGGRRLARDRSLYNLFATLSVACIIDLLTWKPGWTSTSLDQPSFSLCLVQASLIAGNSTAQAASAVALVFKVWLTTIGLSTDKFDRLTRPSLEVALLSLPWLCWLFFFIAALILGIRNPNTVQRESLYCASAHTDIIKSHHYTSAAMGLIVISLEAHLAWMTAGYYRATRRARVEMLHQVDAVLADAVITPPQPTDLEAASSSPASAPAATNSARETDRTSDAEMVWRWQSRLNIPFTLRVLVFGLYTLMLAGIVFYIALVPKAGQTAMPDLVNATIAPMTFIVFGSQIDVLELWWLWIRWPFGYRPERKAAEVDSLFRTDTPDQGRRTSIGEFLRGGPRSPQLNDARRDTDATLSEEDDTPGQKPHAKRHISVVSEKGYYQDTPVSEKSMAECTFELAEYRSR